MRGLADRDEFGMHLDEDDFRRGEPNSELVLNPELSLMG
jgi:hypothetical protein